MKKLGLIGGTGPESTLIYYRTVIEGVQAAAGEHTLPPLMIDSLSVFEVLGFCAREDYDGLTAYLLAGIDSLAAAGCEVASLTALTPHIVFDRLQEASPIEIISAIDATRDAALESGFTKLALLGTEFTMTQEFFAKPLREAGLLVEVPSDSEIDYVQHKIATELEFGTVTDETLAGFTKIIERMRDEHGSEQVILGCTELPLLLNDANSPLPCLDPIDAHTKALVHTILED